MIISGGKNATNPAISPDGRSIAFVEEIRDANIWQIDFSHSSISETNFITSSRADHSPAFSPDGNKIVFASDRSGNFEIWIADADSKNQRQLTYTGKSAGSPRFSPDGKFIAFDVQDSDQSDVFVIPTEGGQVRKITNSETRSILPSWSADGSFLYFTSNQSGSNQLWKIPIEGGTAIQLTKQGAFESFASPDGNAIYFTKERDLPGIWKINTDGRDEIPVVGLEDAGNWRYWTITNNSLYFVADAALPPYKIKSFDLKTFAITDFQTTDFQPIRIYSGLAVSLNYKKILYTRSDQNTASILLAQFEN